MSEIRETPSGVVAEASQRKRDGYGRCASCGLTEGHIDTCPQAGKQGTLTLRAVVTANRQHDMAKYLRELKDQLANSFSVTVHDYYPDANVSAWIEVNDV